MNTLAVNSQKKKKLIELPVDVCKILAIQAAAMGTSVKRLLESRIIKSVEEDTDEMMYSYLCQHYPEGNIAISEKEQSELLKSLRLKVSSDEV